MSTNNGDCGCNTPSQQIARPICPPNGARVTDDRYLTLALAPEGRCLIVPVGSNGQTYLTAEFGGFVMFHDGKVKVFKDIQLTLTLLNPAVSSAYPVPSGFKYLMAGSGDPTDWRHFAAPTSGTYVLSSVNGAWVLRDAGSIPGLQEIGSSGLTTVRGSMMMLVNTGTDEAPVWAIRRLAVVDKRIVVGQVDGDTGAQTYTSLPAGSFLEHPKAKFTTLQSRTFATLDADGNPISGGIEQGTVTGGGSISDPTAIVYSPTTLRFYKAPPPTLTTTNVATNSSTQVPPTSYALMPGGHGAGSSVQFNYAKVRIDFTIGMSNGAASNTQSFGIFRDGVMLAEFDNDNIASGTFVYIDPACPFGAHQYDVRWKKTSGSTSVVIRNSSLVVSTVAQ